MSPLYYTCLALINIANYLCRKIHTSVWVVCSTWQHGQPTYLGLCSAWYVSANHMINQKSSWICRLAKKNLQIGGNKFADCQQFLLSICWFVNYCITTIIHQYYPDQQLWSISEAITRIRNGQKESYIHI